MTTTHAAPPKPPAPARPAPPPSLSRSAQSASASPAQPDRPAAPASAEGEGGSGGFAALLLQQTQDAWTQNSQAAGAGSASQAGVGAQAPDAAVPQPGPAPGGDTPAGEDTGAAALPRRGGASSRPGHAAAAKPGAAASAADAQASAADTASAPVSTTAAQPDAANAAPPQNPAALTQPAEALRPVPENPVAPPWSAPIEAAGQSALQAGLAAGTPAASPADAALPAPALPGAFAQAELDLHPGATGFAGALGAQLKAWVEGGVAQARLHLNPRQLGPIEVRIALHQGRTRLDLHAQAASTREAIERALPQLQALVAASVADVGLALAASPSTADVTEGSTADRSGPQSQGGRGDPQGEPTARMAHRLSQAFAQTPTEDPAQRTRAAPVPAGGLDLYA